MVCWQLRRVVQSAVEGGKYPGVGVGRQRGRRVCGRKFCCDQEIYPQPLGLEADRQKTIIGRTKVDNIELDDQSVSQKSHKSLATTVDAHGIEHDILRDNMPFGSAGRGEFGTYFIGDSRRLWMIESMLREMFIGDPEGAYDKLLDFSTAQSGTTFFAPSRSVLARRASGKTQEDARSGTRSRHQDLRDTLVSPDLA